MDFDKVIEDLDFVPEGLTCDARRMMWLSNGRSLPTDIWPAETNRQGCQEKGTAMFLMRLCPCWNDPRKMEWRKAMFRYGLPVYQYILCPAHESYFRDYMTFPFLCPGCGVHFENVDEILLRKQDIKEML